MAGESEGTSNYLELKENLHSLKLMDLISLLQWILIVLKVFMELTMHTSYCYMRDMEYEKQIQPKSTV